MKELAAIAINRTWSTRKLRNQALLAMEASIARCEAAKDELRR